MIPPASPERKPGEIQSLFRRIAGRYDFANHLLSGGLDFLWRARAVATVAARSPARVLDLATGSGDLLLALERKMPGCFVVGADFCEPMLSVARQKTARQLVVADGLALPFPEASFDAVTVAFGLRNMADWGAAIAEMRRVLRPGGLLLVLDFSLPRGILRPLYRIYLHRLLPVIAGLATGEPRAYAYLGASIEEFPAGERMLALFAANGLAEAAVTELTGGIVSIYTGCRG